MRKLQTKDIFQALRLIQRTNLRETLKPVLQRAAGGGMSAEDVGVDGMLAVLDVLIEEKAEVAFYEFLAGPLECLAVEVESLPLNELAASMKQLAEENDLKVFFTGLSALITTKS